MVTILRENIFIITVTFFVTLFCHVPLLHHILCTCKHSKTGNNEHYERFQFSSLSAFIAPVPFQYVQKRLSSALQDKELLLTKSYGENA